VPDGGVGMHVVCLMVGRLAGMHVVQEEKEEK
jgi:hypothetical protein